MMNILFIIEYRKLEFENLETVAKCMLETWYAVSALDSVYLLIRSLLVLC